MRNKACRSYTNRFYVFLSALAALLVLSAPKAQAATLIVGGYQDEVVDDQLCNMREAIYSINIGMDLFGCASFLNAEYAKNGGPSDYLVLAEGTYVIGRPPEGDGDDNVTGDFDIYGTNLTIQGQGQGKTVIDAQELDRAFHLLEGTLVLKDLSIINGRADRGGGVRAGQTNTSVKLILDGAEFVGNEASQVGGAVYVDGEGSDPQIDGIMLEMKRSSIHGNLAGLGGGVAIFNTPDARIEHSTIAKNTAQTDGGGIVLGALSTLALRFSTIAENEAVAGGGGGIHILGLVTPILVTRGTIYAGNKASNLANNCTADAPNATSLGGNIIDTNDGGVCSIAFNANLPDPDLIGTDPLLRPFLKSDGTFGYLPQDNSPAIDNNDPAACANQLDQRGVPTPSDGDRDGSASCDSGAMEIHTIYVTTQTDAVDANIGDRICNSAGNIGCTLRAAIQENNAGAVENIVVPGGVNLSLAGENEDVAATGDLDILASVNIFGASPSVTRINGNDLDRIFDLPVIPRDRVVRLSEISLTGGETNAEGGAIRVLGTNNQTTLELYAVQLSENMAGKGGGIYTEEAHINIDSSTFNQNAAILSGGGGLAAKNQANSMINIKNSTFSANLSLSGGAIDTENVGIKLMHTTITENGGFFGPSTGGGVAFRNGTFAQLRGSVIAGNHAQTGPDCFTEGLTNNSASLGRNFLGELAGCGFPFMQGDIVPINANEILDPMLLELANYGGETLTHLPKINSPLINAAQNSADCTTYDQRGVVRAKTAEDRCDIGSVEFSWTTDGNIKVVIVDSADPVDIGGLYSYTIDVINQSSTSVDNVVVNVVPTYAHTTQAMFSNNCLVDNNDFLVCNLGSFAGGEAKVITLDVQAVSAGIESVMATAVVSDNPFYEDKTDNTATETTQIIAQEGDLVLDISDSPDPVLVGNDWSYTFSVENASASVLAANVQLDITLPQNQGISSLPNECQENLDNTVTCLLGDMGPNATNDVVISMTALTVGQVNVVATATMTNPEATSANNTDISETTLIIDNQGGGPNTGIGILVDSTPAIATIGDAFTAKVQVINTDATIEQTNMILTITLPAGQTYVGNDKNCQVDNANNPTLLTCTAASLAAGATYTVNINYTANTAGVATTDAKAIADGVSGVQGSDATTVQPLGGVTENELAINVQAVAAQVVPGINFQYQVTVSNLNVSDVAVTPTVTLILPNNADYVGVSGLVGGTCAVPANNQVVCNLDDMAADSSNTFTVTFTASEADQQVVLTATVTGQPENNIANNTDSAIVIVAANANQAADVAIDLSSTDTDVDPGDQILVLASVTNNGPQIATNIVFTLELVQFATFVSTTAPDMTCTNNLAKTLITCSITTLANDETLEAELIFTVPDNVGQTSIIRGDITSSDQPESDLTNNTDTINFSIVEDAGNGNGSGENGGNNGGGGNGGGPGSGGGNNVQNPPAGIEFWVYSADRSEVYVLEQETLNQVAFAFEINVRDFTPVTVSSMTFAAGRIGWNFPVDLFTARLYVDSDCDRALGGSDNLLTTFSLPVQTEGDVTVPLGTPRTINQNSKECYLVVTDFVNSIPASSLQGLGAMALQLPFMLGFIGMGAIGISRRRYVVLIMLAGLLTVGASGCSKNDNNQYNEKVYQIALVGLGASTQGDVIDNEDIFGVPNYGAAITFERFDCTSTECSFKIVK